MEEFGCRERCCKLNFIKQIHEFKSDPKAQSSPRQSAGVAVLKENGTKLLLTQSYNNMWGVPKGKQEHGETLMECACREVSEEAGIHILPESLKGSSVIKYIPGYDKTLTIYIFVYKMTDIDIITWNLDNIKMDNLHFDSTGIGWAKLNCLLENNFERRVKLNSLTRYIAKKLGKTKLSVGKYQKITSEGS